MPMNLSDYPKEWPAISRAVRDAAGNKCQRCGVANGAVIFRAVDGKSWYDPAQDCYFAYPSGERLADWFEADMREKFTRVVLTVAHLDAEGDVCRCEEATGKKCGLPEHLEALCNACHLIYDNPRHVANRRANLLSSKAAGSLFAEAAT